MSRVLNYAITQLRITLVILKKINKFDIAFFGYGSELLIPVTTVKIFNKKIILNVPKEPRRQENNKGLFSKILSIFRNVNFIQSDIILDKTSKNKNYYRKKGFNKKVVSVPDFYINKNHFKKYKCMMNRPNKIGYIGRFSKVKGISKFIDAMKILIRKEQNISYLIGGDGDLRKEVIACIENINSKKRVEYKGWINYQNLPKNYNDIKLLVIPSFSETGPKTALESMACGTPVLATNVGLIPDLIKDGENGFILENNEPETIARRVREIMERDDLNKISKNAQELINKKYTFENVAREYEKILSNMD